MLLLFLSFYDLIEVRFKKTEKKTKKMSEQISTISPETVANYNLPRVEIFQIEAKKNENITAVPPEDAEEKFAKINSAKSEALMAIKTIEPSEQKDLSVEDAASEYLSILDDLSSDFTNPRATTNQLPDGDARTIDTPINKFISKYDKSGGYPQINYRLDQANSIIDAEMAWQTASEQHRIAKEKLSAIDKNRQGQGFFKKIFSYRGYKQEKETLRSELSESEMITYKSNNLLQDTFGRNYSESGQNSYYPKDIKTSSENNSEQNSRFFNNEERQKKIQRAMKLKQGYLVDEIPQHNFKR